MQGFVEAGEEGSWVICHWESRGAPERAVKPFGAKPAGQAMGQGNGSPGGDHDETKWRRGAPEGVRWGRGTERGSLG